MVDCTGCTALKCTFNAERAAHTSLGHCSPLHEWTVLFLTESWKRLEFIHKKGFRTAVCSVHEQQIIGDKFKRQDVEAVGSVFWSLEIKSWMEKKHVGKKTSED